VFVTNLWEVVERSSAQKKEEERARSVTRTLLGLPLHGSPLVCSPHLIKKGRPTSLGRGEGLTPVVPGRRERKKRKVEAVVVGDKRARSSAQFVSHPLLMVNDIILVTKLIREQLLLALHHLPLSLLPPRPYCLAIQHSGPSKKVV